MVVSVSVAFAQNTAPAAGKTDKAPIIVRDVKFAQTTLGGQINKWNRMQVELMMVRDRKSTRPELQSH